MNRIISLFLFIFITSCLNGQYNSPIRNKVTLGKQTTADGLVFRGEASIDTVTATSKITRANKQDTSAFILLDTVTNLLWHYKTASNGWIQAGGSTFDTTTLNLVSRFALKLNITDTTSMLTNYYRSGRALGTPLTGTLTNATGLPLITGVTGILSVANGGTGSATLSGASIITGSGTSNKIPKFNGTSSLTNSKLNDDATILAYTGNEIVAGDNSNNDAFFTMNATQNNYLQFKDAEGGSGAINYNHTSDYLAFKVAGSNRLTIKSNGYVGIGTETPLAFLNVMGTVRINSASAADLNYYLQLENSSSEKAKANAWDTYSDKRIKTAIQPIFNAIDKVNLLNPVYYQKHDSYVENDFLNIDFDSSVKSLGFIAQEVYNVIPEAVNTGTTNELWAMDYTKIIPILTKAIQEQQALIKALEQRILILENK